MSKGSIKQRPSATRSSGAAVLLRLVLLIAAWQGPIPWCHSHAAHATEGSGSWLTEHLVSHHGTQISRGGGLLGWHFHADFPVRPAGDEQPGPGQLPAEFPPSSVGGGRLADLHSGDRLVPLGQLPAAEELQQALSHAAERVLACSPTGFFDGYAAALPLPLRFCILRC